MSAVSDVLLERTACGRRRWGGKERGVRKVEKHTAPDAPEAMDAAPAETEAKVERAAEAREVALPDLGHVSSGTSTGNERRQALTRQKRKRYCYLG